MADALSINDKTTDGFVGEIEATLTRLDIPKSLSSIGVPLDCASRVAEKAMFDSAASTNPVKGNSSDIKALIESSILEARQF
jgi:alcohol dehydrogenase class IV